MALKLIPDPPSQKMAFRNPRESIGSQAQSDSSILPTSSQNRLRRSRVFVALASAVLPVTLSGCHSASINATVSNHTVAPISLVQVEYPSASFGAQTIAPGADFHYRFKILGSGQMKITYTDIAQHEQKSTGPTLTEGTEGALAITVAPDGVHWQSPSPTH